MIDLILFVLMISPVIFIGVIAVLFLKVMKLKKRYLPIVNMDEEIKKLQKEITILTQEKSKRFSECHGAKTLLYQYKIEISLLEENLDDISYGLYKPHFTFQTSEGYKRRHEEIWEKEKALIHEKKAVVCSTKWNVGGSEKDGERMANQNMKLILRAFNGECDAALSKVSWNNILKMEERIKKSFDTINSFGNVLNISITQQYLVLKVDEIRCAYEYEQKKHDEQEEQRRIREEMREEEKAQRELENARIAAEKEESRYQKALEIARQEIEHASGEMVSRLNEQIRILEEKLTEAHAQKERAISQAQLTKSGNVYVISNIGSFGEDVYKIGMTRRLDPMDRVRELGDASVPFSFDVHAIIYSDNAPKLEYDLHECFKEQSVNLVNMRKEFFKIPLADIEKCARRLGAKIEFTKIAEAREYRESIAIRAKQSETPSQALHSEPEFKFDDVGDLVIEAK